MRRRKEKGPGLIAAFVGFIALTFFVAVLLVAVFWPQIYSYLSAHVLPKPAEPEEPLLPPDAEFYYRLKNESCRTLSGDFLIVTEDVSAGEFSGIPDEREALAAESILSRYDYSQTTRTYVRGDQMKKVLENGNITHTTIWKEGRIYQCNPECTMRLLGDEGWQAHLDSLEGIRSACAHFGRTELPPGVNLSRLLRIERTGQRTVSGFRCENFLIYPDKDYAEELLDGPLQLDGDQEALLWGLARSAGPVEECLDDGIGVIVYRNLSFDMTGIYRFDYAPGGYARITQRTELSYYSDSVPASFLALPS